MIFQQLLLVGGCNFYREGVLNWGIRTDGDGCGNGGGATNIVHGGVGLGARADEFFGYNYHGDGYGGDRGESPSYHTGSLHALSLHSLRFTRKVVVI